jgi:uncharacterized protein YndB with AHSA1/START domain
MLERDEMHEDVRVDVKIDAPPRDVWVALTTPATLKHLFYNLVTFTLDGSSGSTKVVLTQSSADGAAPPTAAARDEFAKNWSRMLAGLKETVEGERH